MAQGCKFTQSKKQSTKLQQSVASFGPQVTITRLTHYLHTKLLLGNDDAKNKKLFVFYRGKDKHVGFDKLYWDINWNCVL